MNDKREKILKKLIEELRNMREPGSGCSCGECCSDFGKAIIANKTANILENIINGTYDDIEDPDDFYLMD